MLTKFALSNRTLMVAAMLICLVAGPLSFLTHPSREDPVVTIRNAQVIAQFPGMSAKRIEDLITSKVEEKIREIPEVHHIESTSSIGMSLVSVVVRDEYNDMASIWADLRNKLEDIVPELPDGTIGPVVKDDRGNVAMATIAMTAEGFENQEMREAAKTMRKLIYSNIPGVRKVEFFGVEEQRVFIEFDNIRISQLGIDPNLIVDAVQRQNVILPGGRVESEGSTITIEPTGDFGELDDISSLSVRIDGDPPTTVYLRDIADIRIGYEEPPGQPTFYNGKPAVVISISMVDQVDSKKFSLALKELVASYESMLPWGFKLDFITFQQNEIDDAINSVLTNLWQTVLVVLLVVVAFLGLRTGLIVGAMVPLVMLISTLVMRYVGIELERMSMASLIISLGLLVDNGIVVAEEMQGRIQRGQDRVKAAMETGSSLIFPLLAASLTTIFAFMPLMLAPGGAGEYTRSISLVIAIALAISWVVALTLLILFCIWFMGDGKKSKAVQNADKKSDQSIDETGDEEADADDNAVYDRWYYQRYRGLLAGVIRFRWLVLVGAAGFCINDIGSDLAV